MSHGTWASGRGQGCRRSPSAIPCLYGLRQAPEEQGIAAATMTHPYWKNFVR